MIDLYTAGTGNGRRASVMLEECGLPYVVHRVDLVSGESKTPAFLTLNPMGVIPVIVDKDGPGGKPLTLAQSGAIALYLAEKTGKFLPADLARRAPVLQWFMHVMSDQQPTSSAIFYTSSLPDKPASAIAKFETRLTDFLRFVDKRLGEVEYLAGELSVADFALYPLAAGRQALIDKVGGLDNLKRWTKALAARPGVARGMQAS
ncbi:MAG: glutathione S-transferase N-terminal domain-containing protein [Rhodospirillales bacterium]|nr:glutathione S-transferase N-terminal domain-containing protein [Rhodospirillales bacterium]